MHYHEFMLAFLRLYDVCKKSRRPLQAHHRGEPVACSGGPFTCNRPHLH